MARRTDETCIIMSLYLKNEAPPVNFLQHSTCLHCGAYGCGLEVVHLHLHTNCGKSLGQQMFHCLMSAVLHQCHQGGGSVHCQQPRTKCRCRVVVGNLLALCAGDTAGDVYF